MSMCRLIVCFDGTWNTPDSGSTSTNVVSMVRAIPNRDGDIAQITFYDKGVGTGNVLDRFGGGAFGEGLTDNVIDGYRFLGNNYTPGDEIYIFGFSRGAYTARSLAGLVALSGLLSPAHLGRDLQKVVDICRSDPDSTSKRDKIAALGLVRDTDVRIRCVGVWDTVGSLGIPGDLGRKWLPSKYYFHDVELSPRVDVALHAVAIDEKRSAFAPTLWVRPKAHAPTPGQVIEQVWFPGVHSNVGGSYADEGLAAIALEWMAKRVTRHTTLKLDWNDIRANCRPNVAGKGYESRTALYTDSKLYPYQRLINQTIPEGGGVGEWFRRTFEAGDRRNIIPADTITLNEALHVAALERWKLPKVMHDCDENEAREVPYRPVNLEAVIRKRNVPVVDWNGEVIPPADVSWP